MNKVLSFKYKQEIAGGLSWAEANQLSWQEINQFSWFGISGVLQFFYEVQCGLQSMVSKVCRVAKDYTWRVRL